MELNPNFGDLLSAFDDRRVRFLLVGGYALSFYGRPRTTGDLDLWVEPTSRNAARVLKIPISLLSEPDFIKNKRALGRARDLADAEEISALLQKKRKPRA